MVLININRTSLQSSRIQSIIRSYDGADQREISERGSGWGELELCHSNLATCATRVVSIDSIVGAIGAGSVQRHCLNGLGLL